MSLPAHARLTARKATAIEPGTWLAQFAGMTDLLRATPLLVAPTWSARFAAGLTAAAIALALLGSREEPRGMKRVSLVPAVAAAAAPMSMLSAAVSLPPLAPPVAEPMTGAFFVFQLDGASYLRLADLEDHAMKTRVPLQLREHEGTWFANAPLAPDEVPAAYRGWLGRHVIADERCSAHVAGFEVVAQLTGDPGYADFDGADWTAEAVRDHGHPMIAARLDGCADASLARDAAAPRFEIPAAVTSPASDQLIAKARRAVLTSKVATQAQRRWAEGGGEGRWEDAVELDTRVLRHQGTKTTWVVVFAHTTIDDCGAPEINLLVTFKAGAGGALSPVTQRFVEELHELEVVLDTNGDGELEMLGKPWLGYDRLLTDPSGEVIDRLEVPFYGCPC